MQNEWIARVCACPDADLPIELARLTEVLVARDDPRVAIVRSCLKTLVAYTPDDSDTTVANQLRDGERRFAGTVRRIVAETLAA